MQAPTIVDLRRALCEIRDAAKEVRASGWPAAPGLHAKLQDNLNLTASNFEIAAHLQALKDNVHHECLAWLGGYSQSESDQDCNDLSEALVLQVDTLLTALDAERGATERIT